MSQVHDLPNTEQIPNQVEDTDTEVKETSYKILKYNTLPKNFSSLVYATWLNSLRFGNDLIKVLPSDSYYKTYSTFIGAIIDLPKSFGIAG